MRAIGVVESGGPEALEVIDLPGIPEPVWGWVRIRVRAAAVHRGDVAFREGARALMAKGSGVPSYVPGMSAAGVLDKLGDGVVTDLQVGDDVMAVVHPVAIMGAYADYVVVPLKSVVRIPAGATYAEAATLPLNGLAARLALDVLGLSPGDTVAVTGAAGGVGGYAVQLAKADGLRVIADASPTDRDLVAKLGADHVVGRGACFAEQVRGITPSGADGVVDAASLNNLVVPAVRDGGRVALLRGFLRGFLEQAERGVTYRSVFVATYARDPERLDRLRRQAEGGQVSLRVADVLPAEEAAKAHRLLEAGGIRGQLVLEF